MMKLVYPLRGDYGWAVGAIVGGSGLSRQQNGATW
jgi:hypothetical protein